MTTYLAAAAIVLAVFTMGVFAGRRDVGLRQAAAAQGSALATLDAVKLKLELTGDVQQTLHEIERLRGLARKMGDRR